MKLSTLAFSMLLTAPAAAQAPPAVLGQLAPQFGKMKQLIDSRPNCISFSSNISLEERAYVHIRDLNGNGQADEGEPVAEAVFYKTQNACDISLHIRQSENGNYSVIKKYCANEPHKPGAKSETIAIEGSDWNTASNKALHIFSGMGSF
jgi:hypothetical protein